MKFFLSLLLVGTSLSAKADNIVNVASNAGNFNTLLKAAVEAGMGYGRNAVFKIPTGILNAG